MMARSHLLIGLAAVAACSAAGLLAASPLAFAAAALGGLAPDIDHPGSALGRPLFFLSRPLNRLFGHRGATHSLAALALIFLLLDRMGPPGWEMAGRGFLIGYAVHIAADMLTREGCALFYPLLRGHVRLWPSIRTGGAAEPLVVFLVVAALLSRFVVAHAGLLLGGHLIGGWRLHGWIGMDYS